MNPTQREFETLLRYVHDPILQDGTIRLLVDDLLRSWLGQPMPKEGKRPWERVCGECNMEPCICSATEPFPGAGGVTRS